MVASFRNIATKRNLIEGARGEADSREICKSSARNVAHYSPTGVHLLNPFDASFVKAARERLSSRQCPYREPLADSLP
jgi:hypothetical protein